MPSVLVGLLEDELRYLSHWASIMWKSALWIIVKSPLCLSDTCAYHTHV